MPEAKLFVTASAEVRAHAARGIVSSRGSDSPMPSRVAGSAYERDLADRDRSTAPLRPADDAVAESDNLPRWDIKRAIALQNRG